MTTPPTLAAPPPADPAAAALSTAVRGVVLAADEASWLLVLLDHSVPTHPGGPMDWDTGAGRRAAESLLGRRGPCTCNPPRVDLPPAPGCPVHAPACRVCGCTDGDASTCVAVTGRPCTWTRPDVCSRCADAMPDGPPDPEPDHLAARRQEAHYVGVTEAGVRIAVTVTAHTGGTPLDVVTFPLPLSLLTGAFPPEGADLRGGAIERVLGLGGAGPMMYPASPEIAAAWNDRGDYLPGERVEWNPTGDRWVPGTVMGHTWVRVHLDTDDVPTSVQLRHLRALEQPDIDDVDADELDGDPREQRPETDLAAAPAELAGGDRG